MLPKWTHLNSIRKEWLPVHYLLGISEITETCIINQHFIGSYIDGHHIARLTGNAVITPYGLMASLSKLQKRHINVMFPKFPKYPKYSNKRIVFNLMIQLPKPVIVNSKPLNIKVF